MQSFPREMGFSEDDGRHPVRQNSLGARNPPRTSPPRVPLPELPRGDALPSVPTLRHGEDPSTPPPAYMSSR